MRSRKPANFFRHRILLILTALLFLLSCLGPYASVEELRDGVTSSGAASSPVPPAVTEQPAHSDAAAQGGVLRVTPVKARSLWFDAPVPLGLRLAAKLPGGVNVAASREQADLAVQVVPGENSSTWVYALVAPFSTLEDGVRFEDLLKGWHGEASLETPLLMDTATLAAFETIWGPASPDAVRLVETDKLLQTAWDGQPSRAIVPFEELDPRWKVLRVDGQSPFDRALDVNAYPLVVPFSITDLNGTMQAAEAGAWLPATNRQVEKMTVLVMTGVTALVRATGSKMEKKGMTYPARDIGGWLREADLTHISNEIPFSPNCAKANPDQETLQFCSRPEYIELLEDVGTDIVELTGNHMLDYNADSFAYTLQMYRDRGWGFYAAGENLEAARKALLVEDHGNKLAFIGCNPAGPPHAWAAEASPGVANCDDEWMHAEIARLKADGYLPIATFQYHEYYSPEARPWQEEDFTGMAKAGAVIVSGSQAHLPQAMDFYHDSFIHYGLGNLFFDQMDVPVVGTRREFLDRHIFYDGKYLGTELLTALLEEYARPRPMTAEERSDLLRDIFIASGWMDE